MKPFGEAATNAAAIGVLMWAASTGALAAPDGPASGPASQLEVAPTLPEVRIESSRNSELGIADVANSGTVTQRQLEARVVYRPGELLEAMPGLIVSQHSGEGKANQFYLRGFNLDHGTDLRTTVDGMLVNQRSHAHGQGWTDLNFVIPEIATQFQYRKGPYFAAEGDFSSAGAASLRYADRLDHGIASLGIGQYGFRRVLLADSPAWGNGHLLYALEAYHNDGPFDRPDDYRKLNGVLRYSEGNAANGFHVAGMAYHGKWNSTDQIPRRAVEAGALSRFGAIDPTDGGAASRYSVSGAWRRTTSSGRTEVDAYVVRQRLDLFSNFTYFLDDPVNGDQFAQPDRRVTTGLNASHTWAVQGVGLGSEWRAGVQLQNDNIFNGLYRTADRQRISTTRQDHIVEQSIGVYLQNTTYWKRVVSHRGGSARRSFPLRREQRRCAQLRHRQRQHREPETRPGVRTLGQDRVLRERRHGFHSNDARGTTINFDPKTNEPGNQGAAAGALARCGSRRAHRDRARACKARCRSTGSTSTPNSCSLATPARRKRAGPAGASASSFPTTGARRAGSRWMPTSPTHRPASKSPIRPATASRARSKAWPRSRWRWTASGRTSAHCSCATSARDR